MTSTSSAAVAADASAIQLEVPDRVDARGQRRQKPPKRLVYFSDGVLEEYSTEDEVDGNSDHEDADKPIRRLTNNNSSSRGQRSAVVHLDPRQLAWLPWMWHYSCLMGRGLLRTADYCGERVAWLLGITTPKYGYIIREYHRIREEEAKEKVEREAELEARRKWEADQQVSAESPVAAHIPMTATATTTTTTTTTTNSSSQN